MPPSFSQAPMVKEVVRWTYWPLLGSQLIVYRFCELKSCHLCAAIMTGIMIQMKLDQDIDFGGISVQLEKMESNKKDKGKMSRSLCDGDQLDD